MGQRGGRTLTRQDIAHTHAHGLDGTIADARLTTGDIQRSLGAHTHTRHKQCHGKENILQYIRIAESSVCVYIFAVCVSVSVWKELECTPTRSTCEIL